MEDKKNFIITPKIKKIKRHITTDITQIDYLVIYYQATSQYEVIFLMYAPDDSVFVTPTTITTVTADPETPGPVGYPNNVNVMIQLGKSTNIVNCAVSYGPFVPQYPNFSIQVAGGTTHTGTISYKNPILKGLPPNR